jgi:ribonuclease-3 family protein
MLLSSQPSAERVEILPLRLLANLGDAVCNLYEREKALSLSSSVDQMHRRVRSRVNAKAQSDRLDRLMPSLSEKEQDIVRRARNLKATNYRKTEQATYRKSTAIEALLGYLYLCDLERLKNLLNTSSEELEPGNVDSILKDSL